MMNKEELRAGMRARRKAMTQRQQNDAARAVLVHLEGFAPFLQARCVMAYVAVRGELSLDPVIELILRSRKTLALPCCEAPGVMTARRIDALSALESGAYGLLEPGKGCAVVEPEEIDLILVPGTAFDTQGCRLGQGGGYYDRFLSRTRALRVGVCHEFALIGDVPVQAHDVNMHHILTPGGMIACGQEASEYTDIQEEQP